LVFGTNTLAVVVIDPGGQRYQQVVSFGVARTTRPGAGDVVAVLPALPGRISRPPASMRRGVDLHFEAALVADRLKASEAFVKHHSATQAQTFSSRKA
jgi:hypothetical protein